jgi:hypothetical protein
VGSRRVARVGWRNSRYDGPAEGRPEFKGYYQGRRKARG